MEEKLYFKPEGYGKGKKKKQQTEQRVEKNTEGKDHKVLKLVCLLLFLLILIIIIIWLIHGKTTTTGEYPANVKNESLECTSHELTYNKLGIVSPAPKETALTLTAVFSGGNELRTLSLKNLMTFESNSEAIVAEARTHANFNIGLRAYNYGTDKFDNKFSIMHEKLLVNLTLKKTEFDEFSKDYFLIISSDPLPSSLEDFQKEYEAQGFTCRTTFDEPNN